MPSPEPAAALSRLGILFGSGVASEWTPIDGPTSELFDEELEGLERAVEKRRREHRAGRHCARRALAKLGFAPVAIPRRHDRTPVWPEGIVGSITHTGRGDEAVAIAVVARSESHESLGIDAEQNTPLKGELLSRVLTPAEERRLSQQTLFAPGILAKLTFCAKEAYYKCQYPLTGEFLDFSDVEIRWDFPGARFEASVMRPDFSWPTLKSLRGRYVADDKLLLCGMEVRA